MTDVYNYCGIYVQQCGKLLSHFDLEHTYDIKDDINKLTND